ncbi:MAG: hypothetical protein OEY94_02485 [Alphaproteobacteria bacterium]|nr:hypothetical protein [Alphaproteobacteria bacterium]
MSDVKASDFSEIDSPGDVWGLYQGVGVNSKSGIETEFPFFSADEPDMPAMNLSQNKALKQAAMNALQGDWLRNEPTSDLLEVTSIAMPFKEWKTVLDDTQKKINILSQKAGELGLKRSYFQEFPDKTADELLSRIVDIERYKIMYAPYRADMYECVRYFAVCKSMQVSVSPGNEDHMLENIRRLYTLAPFLFLLTGNSSGFMEGKFFSGHQGMFLRRNGLRENRGGIPPYVYTAQSGEEFIANHIHHVMNNPLFMFYDRKGVLTRVPSGDWSVTFESLKKKGLNTGSNYFLAQSIMWPDVKIAALTDESGDVYAHRYEARMFGVGNHQHQTAYLITTALAFDPDFAHSVDGLLKAYGFDQKTDLPYTYKLVKDAYSAAENHNGAFFDIAYGNGRMSDFAKIFADLLENMAERHDMRGELLPAITICRTGCTDSKVNCLMFPTYEEVLNFQKSYDPAIFDNPNLSASMIFEDRMSTKTGNLNCAA